MVAASLVLLQIFPLFLGIYGKLLPINKPCDLPEESVFRCDSKDCILKRNWCDGKSDCDDGSDEKYCPSDIFESCDELKHFPCSSGNMCIPYNGYCDGLESCPDDSDELECPCEDLHGVIGNIEEEVLIGKDRTHHKCWKLAVNKRQQVTVNIKAILSDRACHHGMVSVFVKGGIFLTKTEKTGAFLFVACPGYVNNRTFNFTSDVNILYRSTGVDDSNSKDSFKITYSKGWENPCLSLEKQCDGVEDCENGQDEQNCDFGHLAEYYLEENRNNATRWMRSQLDPEWGWKENTQRALVALYLGSSLNLQNHHHDDLVEKLELEVSTYLLRSTFEKQSPIDLSANINALIVMCHNPRNFYGFDLVQKLKEEIEKTPGYVTPFPYLTLCNAKESISTEVVEGLLQTLERQLDYGFILEVRALTLMALSCISSYDQYNYLKQNITDTLNELKREQKEDGSFGNEYTTALVLQALIANNQANDRDWNFKASVEYLQKQQKADGSFGDFLTTYLLMPPLNAKSLVDVGKVNCTRNFKRPKEGHLVSDIKTRLGGKVPVKYSLVIGDGKDQILPIILRTPENITVLELMTLAADIDPKYKFKTQQIKNKTYVYEIAGIPNDPERNIFWFLYQQDENGPVLTLKQSPDEVHVGENDHILMWYRTLIM